MSTHLFIAPKLPKPRRASGFTLIEVLVTVVVISVGLLGVAALQLISLRDTHSSYLRGQASALADDIMDRIRANRSNAPAYIVSATGTLSTGQPGTDVTEWKAQIASLLPQTRTGSGTVANASGAIAVTTISANRYLVQVTITWGERVENRTVDNSMQFVTRSEI